MTFDAELEAHRLVDHLRGAPASSWQDRERAIAQLAARAYAAGAASRPAPERGEVERLRAALERVAGLGLRTEWGFARGSLKVISWKCHLCDVTAAIGGPCQNPGCASTIARRALAATPTTPGPGPTHAYGFDEEGESLARRYALANVAQEWAPRCASHCSYPDTGVLATCPCDPGDCERCDNLRKNNPTASTPSPAPTLVVMCRSCVGTSAWDSGVHEARADPCIKCGFPTQWRYPSTPSPVGATGEKTWPCARCGVQRTAAEGGTVFTVCDDCWLPRESGPSPVGATGLDMEARAQAGGFDDDDPIPPLPAVVVTTLADGGESIVPVCLACSAGPDRGLSQYVEPCAVCAIGTLRRRPRPPASTRTEPLPRDPRNTEACDNVRRHHETYEEAHACAGASAETETGEARQFPVLAGADRNAYARLGMPRSVPWALLAPHEARALSNHGQSLEVLASRGGLGPSEMRAIIEDKKWRDIPKMTPAEEFAWLTLWLAPERLSAPATGAAPKGTTP